MAKPCSDDFRRKLMQAIELDGLKKSEASQLFHIGRNTIHLWCERQAATADIEPQPRQTSGAIEQQNHRLGEVSSLRACEPRQNRKLNSLICGAAALSARLAGVAI